MGVRCGEVGAMLQRGGCNPNVVPWKPTTRPVSTAQPHPLDTIPPFPYHSNRVFNFPLLPPPALPSVYSPLRTLPSS